MSRPEVINQSTFICYYLKWLNLSSKISSIYYKFSKMSRNLRNRGRIFIELTCDCVGFVQHEEFVKILPVNNVFEPPGTPRWVPLLRSTSMILIPKERSQVSWLQRHQKVGKIARPMFPPFNTILVFCVLPTVNNFNSMMVASDREKWSPPTAKTYLFLRSYIASLRLCPIATRYSLETYFSHLLSPFSFYHRSAHFFFTICP